MKLSEAFTKPTYRKRPHGTKVLIDTNLVNRFIQKHLDPEKVQANLNEFNLAFSELCNETLEYDFLEDDGFENNLWENPGALEAFVKDE